MKKFHESFRISGIFHKIPCILIEDFGGYGKIDSEVIFGLERSESIMNYADNLRPFSAQRESEGAVIFGGVVDSKKMAF
ncbi:MAG: hypothetical protein IJ225_09745 [Solobacterium sp.]|nr:hypothetical protein [Solobacterium sp.]